MTHHSEPAQREVADDRSRIMEQLREGHQACFEREWSGCDVRMLVEFIEQDAVELTALRAMKARAKAQLKHYSRGKAYLERREVASLLQRILNGEEGQSHAQ